jgi:hypothetical protein
MNSKATNQTKILRNAGINFLLFVGLIFWTLNPHTSFAGWDAGGTNHLPVRPATNEEIVVAIKNAREMFPFVAHGLERNLFTYAVMNYVPHSSVPKSINFMSIRDFIIKGGVEESIKLNWQINLDIKSNGPCEAHDHTAPGNVLYVDASSDPTTKTICFSVSNLHKSKISLHELDAATLSMYAHEMAHINGMPNDKQTENFAKDVFQAALQDYLLTEGISLSFKFSQIFNLISEFEKINQQLNQIVYQAQDLKNGVAKSCVDIVLLQQQLDRDLVRIVSESEAGIPTLDAYDILSIERAIRPTIDQIRFICAPSSHQKFYAMKFNDFADSSGSMTTDQYFSEILQDPFLGHSHFYKLNTKFTPEPSNDYFGPKTFQFVPPNDFGKIIPQLFESKTFFNDLVAKIKRNWELE